ncbi:MAG: flagellar biosynthesis protein FlhB [Desulfobacterales bacterium]|nr:flagellar biosynthesis protein FlhB [Desulfobacterales bacterium]
MPEGETGEKTEQATPRKLEKAREEGQVGRSTEIPSVFVLLAGVVSLYFFGHYMYKKMAAILYQTFTFDKVHEMNLEYTMYLLYQMSEPFLKTLLPMMAMVWITALAVNFLQVGFYISWEAISPKLSKLDPIKGFGRIFSSRALIELVKSIIKITIIGLITYFVVKSELSTILRLYDNSIGEILLIILKISYKIAIRVLIVMVFLALFDLGFQKWKFAQEQRMTKQEIKDEYKQTEGDPIVKSRIRQLQYQASRRRMMEEVPKADVVVTNPTHLAVALKYDSLNMNAPQVVAKGAGVIAERIKAIARENNIPVIENKELAQKLYKLVDIGKSIPAEFYTAVAELLAYVYKLKRKK